LARIRRSIETLPASGISLMLHIGKTPDLVSLGLGEPSFRTPKHILDAAIESLTVGDTHYTADEGLLSLRETISEKTLRDNGFHSNPETEVVVTSGTSPALFGAIQVTVDRGDEVIIPTPAYFAYDSIVRIAEGVPVQVVTKEEDRFNPEPDMVANAITPKTKMIIVCSPNNPTGGVLDKECLKAVADLAVDHDLLVLSDELYEKIVYDGVKNYSPASNDGMQDRTLTINGLSKSYAMTGFRLGWLIASKEIITAFQKTHKYSSICAPVVSQAAAITALNGPQDAVIEMVSEYDRRRRLLVDRVNREVPFISARSPQGSFFLLANVKELVKHRLNDMISYLKNEARPFLSSIPQELFTMSDLERSGSLTSMLYLITAGKVLTASGAFFGMGGEGYLRMSFAQTYDNINAAVDNMIDALSKLE